MPPFVLTEETDLCAPSKFKSTSQLCHRQKSCGGGRKEAVLESESQKQRGGGRGIQLNRKEGPLLVNS